MANYDDDSEFQYQINSNGQSEYNQDVDSSIDENAFKTHVDKPKKVTSIVKIVVISVILIFVVYKVVSYFSSDKHPAKKLDTIPPIPIIITKPPIEKPKLVQKDIQVKLPEQKPLVTSEEITGLKTLISHNQDMLSVIKNDQVSSKTQIDKVKTQLTEIKDYLNKLQASNDKIQKEYKARLLAQKRYLANKKSRENQQIRNIKRYYVQAIIPGRAWLKGSDGSVITVTVDDFMPGYGNVISVNSHSGVVKTSIGGDVYFGTSGQ